MPLANPKHVRPPTKQAFVYHTLREAIMRCELEPSERLVIDDLARQLHVSAIPVREALQILQSEGLIVNVPHVGATVAPVSRESILEVFTMLEGLSIVATRLVAERAKRGELEVLEHHVAEMDAALIGGHLEEWASLNTAFHLTIAAMPGLPLLREMTERVLDRWHRVRRYYFSGVLIRRVDQAQGEHRAMVAAMRAQDYDRLLDVVHRHNQGALASYMNYVESNGRAPTVPGRSPVQEAS
jgi:DNA-binding GntR family transcriptional regulator